MNNDWVIPENMHVTLTPQRKFGVKTPYPFGCLNTLAIIRKKIFSPLLLDGRNFLCVVRMNLFWNNPLMILLYTHKNLTSCNKSANMPSTSRVQVGASC
jgi:hypothetical protein